MCASGRFPIAQPTVAGEMRVHFDTGIQPGYAAFLPDECVAARDDPAARAEVEKLTPGKKLHVEWDRSQFVKDGVEKAFVPQTYKETQLGPGKIWTVTAVEPHLKKRSDLLERKLFYPKPPPALSPEREKRPLEPWEKDGDQ